MRSSAALVMIYAGGCDETTRSWSLDKDGDGYNSKPDGDCDDSDPGAHPDAEEICNGRDDDCDGWVDDGIAISLYCWADSDRDGYGDPAVHTCSCPAGYVANDQDCDDADPDVHPGAEELPCNGIDDDCGGGLLAETDNDGDGLAECEGDCVDSSADAYPGGAEICDGLDDDCDGALPDDEADLDGDGEMACAGDCDDTDRTFAQANIEVCDGLDNDCDGTADDDCYSCDLAVPNNFATVQEGIDGAVSGDVVCVGPGTWEERIDFNGATITLRGVAGPAATILRDPGDWGGPVVVFHSGETAATELQGFTVTRGVGGIDISGASPSLSDLVITTTSASASPCLTAPRPSPG